MKAIYDLREKMVDCRRIIVLIVLMLWVCVGCSDKVSTPPVITVFVDNVEVVDNSAITVSENAEVEYRFEIESFTTIVDFKTVFFDISIPDRKKATEVLVGGLSNSNKETVKGIVAPTSDTEVMLIVKDIDGNESAKSFSMKFE